MSDSERGSGKRARIGAALDARAAARDARIVELEAAVASLREVTTMWKNEARAAVITAQERDAEVERLRKALHSIAYSDTEAYSPDAYTLRNRAYYALRNAS